MIEEVRREEKGRRTNTNRPAKRRGGSNSSAILIARHKRVQDAPLAGGLSASNEWTMREGTEDVWCPETSVEGAGMGRRAGRVGVR